MDRVVDTLPAAATSATENKDDDDLSNLTGEKPDAEWDEGGPSQCGYSEAVHSTLMTFGEAIHGVVGDPSPHVEEKLKEVGVWFQEASYATRDIVRGNKLMVDEEELKAEEKTDADKATVPLSPASTTMGPPGGLESS